MSVPGVSLIQHPLISFNLKSEETTINLVNKTKRYSVTILQF